MMFCEVMFCMGDVLLQVTFCEVTFCIGDVLLQVMFCEVMFCRGTRHFSFPLELPLDLLSALF